MPKISKPLTTTEVKNYKPESKMYKKPDGKGLWLIINPNGTKFWRYDFKYGNKNLSMSFGIYPEIGLKEARDKREEARELLTNNINPISVKRIKKASESLTLQNVIDEWIELRKKSSSEATIIQNKRILKNISDWLGSVAIKDIKSVNIITALERMQNRGIIESAHRLLSIMNKIYMYAVTKEYIENNIIANIDKSTILVPNKKDAHLPALIEPKDIKQLLIDINLIGEKFKSDISTIFIFKLIPYIFVRSENIRLMCWDDLNLEKGIWEVPKEKMKMKVDFVCPLPTQAIKILKQIEPFSKYRGKFVFPSPYKNDRGVSGATFSSTTLSFTFPSCTALIKGSAKYHSL